MMNDLESYAEAGRKAAIARNHGDEATALSWADFYFRMRRLEKDADVATARKTFDEAYAAARRVR